MNVKTYFVSNGRYIKIGKSQQPEQRLKELQTGCPEILKIIFQIEGNKESEFHKNFSACRVRNEWFDPEKEPLRSFLRNSKSFYFWLEQQLGRDDVIGDLANDVREDTSFPKEETNYDRIKFYLSSRNASSLAMRAFESAFSEYRPGKKKYRVLENDDDITWGPIIFSVPITDA